MAGEQQGEHVVRPATVGWLMALMRHSLFQPPLVCERLPSFRLLLRPQAIMAFKACSCLSRLATASLSISATDLASIRSRSTGLNI